MPGKDGLNGLPGLPGQKASDTTDTRIKLLSWAVHWGEQAREAGKTQLGIASNHSGNPVTLASQGLYPKHKEEEQRSVVVSKDVPFLPPWRAGKKRCHPPEPSLGLCGRKLVLLLFPNYPPFESFSKLEILCSWISMFLNISILILWLGKGSCLLHCLCTGRREVGNLEIGDTWLPIPLQIRLKEMYHVLTTKAKLGFGDGDGILKKSALNHLLPWIALAEVFLLLMLEPRSSRVPSSHLLMNKGEEFGAHSIFLMLNKLWILSTHPCSTYCSSQLCHHTSTTAASAVHAGHIGRPTLEDHF